MEILFCSRCSTCNKLIELPNTHNWNDVDGADMEITCSDKCRKVKTEIEIKLSE